MNYNNFVCVLNTNYVIMPLSSNDNLFVNILTSVRKRVSNVSNEGDTVGVILIIIIKN